MSSFALAEPCPRGSEIDPLLEARQLLEALPVKMGFPPAPSHTEPGRIAEEAIDLVYEHLHDYDRSIYRPDVGMDREGKGNCYAFTVATCGLLRHWGIPSGVTVDIKHADGLMVADKQVLVVNTAMKEVGSLTGLLINGGDPKGVHGTVATLTDELRRGRCQRYVFRQLQVEGEHVEMEEACKVTTAPVANRPVIPDLARRRRLVADDVRGTAALLAAGDLRRYHIREQAGEPNKLAEKYAALIGWVPEFLRYNIEAPQAPVSNNQ